MSFMDEVKAAKPEPIPEKTEMDLVMECSEEIKSSIMSKARYTSGQFYYEALYLLNYNPKVLINKQIMLTDEKKCLYTVPEKAKAFRDNLKRILAKDGIEVGDWEYKCKRTRREIGWSTEKRIYQHSEGIIYWQGIEPTIGNRLDLSQPLETHYKLGFNGGRFILSQNGKILLEKFREETSRNEGVQIGFRITFTEK